MAQWSCVHAVAITLLSHGLIDVNSDVFLSKARMAIQLMNAFAFCNVSCTEVGVVW